MGFIHINVYRIDDTTSFCNIRGIIKGNIFEKNEIRILDEHDLDNAIFDFSKKHNVDSKDCKLTIEYSSLDALLYRNPDIYLQNVKTFITT